MKFLPPIVFAALCVVTLLIGAFLPPNGPPFLPAFVGAFAFGAAAHIMTRAQIQFQQAGAQINTFLEPRAFQADGIYARSRNPMYLAFLLGLVGLSLLVWSLLALLPPLIFFAIANWWYIPEEEANMYEAFGDEYAAYTTRVRRWI